MRCVPPWTAHSALPRLLLPLLLLPLLLPPPLPLLSAVATSPELVTAATVKAPHLAELGGAQDRSHRCGKGGFVVMVSFREEGVIGVGREVRQETSDKKNKK